MKTYERWTQAEDDYLRENVAILSNPTMAQAIERTNKAVQRRLNVIGATRVRTDFWTPQEDDLLKANYNLLTAKQLEKMLDRLPIAIRKRANALGLSFPDSRIRVWLDEARIPLMSDIQKGYLAGIVDGEGTISIHRVHPTGRDGQFRYQPIMSIAGTDIRLAEYLNVTLDATQNSHIRRRNRPQHKPQMVTGWYGYRCYPIIKLVEPHLLIKREQAQIVMRYIESRAQMPGYQLPYTDEQHELYERIRQLNLKGIPLT